MSDIAKIRAQLLDNIDAQQFLQNYTEESKEALRLFDKMASEEPVIYGLRSAISKQWDGSTTVLAVKAHSYDKDALLPLYTSTFAQPKVPEGIRYDYIRRLIAGVREAMAEDPETISAKLELGNEVTIGRWVDASILCLELEKSLLSTTKEPKAEGVVTVREDVLRDQFEKHVALGYPAMNEHWRVEHFMKAIKDQS